MIQASRGQIIVSSELEANKLYPSLVISSLGANRKEKPGGQITARVLVDGTNGLEVNKRTRVRDQSRISAALGRLTQCMAGTSTTTWHMLVADDFLLESSGGEYCFAMSFFVLSSVLGVPLSWHKTLSGNTLVWVGFELLLESSKVGISQRRAEWFARWWPQPQLFT